MPVAINDAGWIVGDPIVLGPAGFGDEAVLWSPSGKATVLQDAGGPGSVANAINDAGKSVGVSDLSGFQDVVLWSPSGQATVRENLGGIGPSVQSQALAINASGWSVGFSYNQTGTQDAVLWSPSGKVTNLGAVLGSAWTDTEAVGINNRGDILDSGDYDGGTMGFCSRASPPPNLLSQSRYRGSRTHTLRRNGHSWRNPRAILA